MIYFRTVEKVFEAGQLHRCSIRTVEQGFETGELHRCSIQDSCTDVLVRTFVSVRRLFVLLSVLVLNTLGVLGLKLRGWIG